MLTIKGFERRNNNGTTIFVESDEFMPGEDVDIRYLMPDGQLETYLEHYGFPQGASLVAILLDAFYDDIEMPHWQSDYEDEFKRIVALENERITWVCDKNELLAAVTIADDDPESVAGSWLAIKRDLAAKAEAWQQLREEREAAEFVDSLPVAIRSQPRDASSGLPEAAVGLAINFVP